MFQEPTKNVPMAASAIILLVIGVYAVSTSQAKEETNVEVEVVEDVGVRVGVKVGHNQINDVSKLDVENRGENEECKEDYTIFENPMLVKENNGNKDINNLQKENKSDKMIVSSDNNNSNHLSLKNKIKADTPSTDLQDGRKEETVDPVIDAQRLSLNIEDVISRDPKFHDSILSIENESEKKNENENKNENIHEKEISQKNKKRSSTEYFDRMKISFGAYFLCFGVGLCDGTLLVPFKLGNTSDNSILHVFRYLASFGISSIMVSPFMFLLYSITLNGRKIPSFHFRVAALPGISSGVLWASANFLSVHATFYLGKFIKQRMKCYPVCVNMHEIFFGLHCHVIIECNNQILLFI